jgi:hypothetical protein
LHNTTNNTGDWKHNGANNTCGSNTVIVCKEAESCLSCCVCSAFLECTVCVNVSANNPKSWSAVFLSH